MPDERRAARTADKTRRGGLPAPTDYSRQLGLGDGSPCDGCTETIAPLEILFTVRLFGVLSWRFHAVLRRLGEVQAARAS
jgi:hypothetical protein